MEHTELMLARQPMVGLQRVGVKENNGGLGHRHHVRKTRSVIRRWGFELLDLRLIATSQSMRFNQPCQHNEAPVNYVDPWKLRWDSFSG